MGNEAPAKAIDAALYAEISCREDELLSSVIVVEQRTTKVKFLVKILNFVTEVEHQASKILMQRKAFGERRFARNVICLKKFQISESVQICGKNTRASLFLEYLQNDLRAVFIERQAVRRPFSEEQVRLLLKSVVNGLISLNDYGYKNYHLYKESIFLDSSSTYKIIDTLLTNKNSPYIEIVNAIPVKRGTYLAPEVIQLSSDPTQTEGSSTYQTSEVPRKTLIQRHFPLGQSHERISQNFQRIKIDQTNFKGIQVDLDQTKNRRRGTSQLQNSITHDALEDTLTKKKQFAHKNQFNNSDEVHLPKKSESKEQTPAQKLMRFTSLQPEIRPYNFSEDINTPIRKIEMLNSFVAGEAKTEEKKSYGRHAFSSGAYYEGEFNEENEFDGNGMLFYPDGTMCYSGSWRKNCFNGFGILCNEKVVRAASTNFSNFSLNPTNSWSHYEGEFCMDKKQGFGTLVMANGDKFSGGFKADLIAGFGTFLEKQTGLITNGVWVDSALRP